MISFHELIAQGSGWLFVPAAIVLGALHGLESGHSKTMMAAFIVASRDGERQASRTRLMTFANGNRETERVRVVLMSSAN